MLDPEPNISLVNKRDFSMILLLLQECLLDSAKTTEYCHPITRKWRCRCRTFDSAPDIHAIVCGNCHTDAEEVPGVTLKFEISFASGQLTKPKFLVDHMIDLIRCCLVAFGVEKPKIESTFDPPIWR